MSVTVSSWVWAHSSAGGTDRLVLLAIADEADDTGANAWPSIRRLAAKTRTSERTVKRAIRSLVDLGELEVHVGAGGTPDWRADRRPNLYRVIMSDGVPDRHPVLGVDSDGHAPQGTPDPSVDGVPDRHPVEAHGVTPVVERGDTRVTQPTHTREENPCADTSAPKRDLLWEAMLAACGLEGRTPTRSERGAWNRAAKDLRDVDATPEEVHRRAQAFRQRWPHVSLTPTALARRWSEVVAGDTLPPPERTTDPDARRRSIEGHARNLAAAGLDRVDAVEAARLTDPAELEVFRTAFDAALNRAGEGVMCRAIRCGRRGNQVGLCPDHAPPIAPAAAGHMWVACWCERSKTEIPVDQVGKTTGSCGAEGCAPPAELEVDR